MLLNCRASGNPTPQLSWTKDGDFLRVSPRFTVLNGGKIENGFGMKIFIKIIKK